MKLAIHPLTRRVFAAVRTYRLPPELAQRAPESKP